MSGMELPDWLKEEPDTPVTQASSAGTPDWTKEEPDTPVTSSGTDGNSSGPGASSSNTGMFICLSSYCTSVVWLACLELCSN